MALEVFTRQDVSGLMVEEHQKSNAGTKCH